MLLARRCNDETPMDKVFWFFFFKKNFFLKKEAKILIHVFGLA